MKLVKYLQCIFVLILAGFFATEKASTCNEFLVDTVTDDKLTASSKYSSEYTADKAKLSSTGWSPNASEANPWIQVDFGGAFTITEVVTIGLNFKNLDEYVKKYIVRYSNTASNWSTVQYGTTNEFIANSDKTTLVTNALPNPIVARYIRLYPTDCFKYCSLRFDVIGCEVATTFSSTSTLTLPPASTTLRTQTTTTSSSLRTNSIPSSTANSGTTLTSSTYSPTVTTQNNTTTLSSSNSTTSRTPNTYSTLSSSYTSSTTNTQTTSTALSSPTTLTTSSIPTITATISSTPTTYNSLSSSTSTGSGTPTTTTFNSAQAGLCTCGCAQTTLRMTTQEVRARIENIVQNLTVSKKKTSKYIRSKTSAQDTRPEVVYVGSVAIAILCMFASLIVLPDLCTMLRFFYSSLKENK